MGATVPRLATWLRSGAGRDRLYALIDQGLSGVANILIFAMLGRLLPVAEFGAIGMMVGIHYFVAGFHRSAVVLPFATEPHRGASPAQTRAHDSDWWWIGLALAVALSAALTMVALAIRAAAPPGWQWAVTPMLLAAAMTPAMLAWEFARRWLYRIGRADRVAVGAAAYAVTLCGAGAALARVHPSAAAATLAWIAAALAATAVALPLLQPTAVAIAAIRQLIAANRSSSLWLALTNVPYAIYGTATVVVLIGILIGPVAAGLFTVARTLTNPAISLVSAIDSIDKPRAAHALSHGGIAGLRRSIRHSRLAIVLSIGPYLALVAAFAGPLTRLVFHGQFPGLEHEVELLALAFFLFGLNQPSETLMIVLRAGRAMLVVRSVTAILTLLALNAARPWGVVGMATAICATQAVNLAMLMVVEHRLGERRRRREGEA